MERSSENFPKIILIITSLREDTFDLAGAGGGIFSGLSHF